MMVCTCEILAGGQLGQVKSVDIKISFMGGVVLFWSTHIHMQDRLDKPRSALAEARLKIIQKYRCQQWIKHIFLLTYFNYVNFQYSSTHTNH